MSDDLSGFSLMDLFRSEAETHAATLSAGLLALERGGPATDAAVEPMMRAAHSLKGAARIVGLDPAVRVAHVMEDCFVAVQEGRLQLRPSQIDVLLHGVDLLQTISTLEEGDVPRWSLDNEAVLDALVADIRAVLTAPPDSVPETNPVPAPSPSSEAGRSGLDPAHGQAVPGTEPGHDPTHGTPGAIPGTKPIPPQVVEAASDPGRPGRDPAGPASSDGPADASSDSVDQTNPVPTQPVTAAAPGAIPETNPIPPPPPSPPPSRPEAPNEAKPPAAVEAGPPRAAPEAVDRVVKLNADSLTRLMSLAGESLVQSRRLRPFVETLLALRSQNSALLTSLQRLTDRPAGDSSALDEELLARAKSLASQSAQALVVKLEELEDFAVRSEDLADRLHHEVLSSRMRPLSEGVRGFERMVRDVSRGLGKQVRFEVVGENTGVDRDILEKLESPLNHLIRNALDHAIETPEERQAAGKPPTGTIRLEARHRAGMLQLTLTDDGRGVDLDRLRTKIVERRLATAAMATQLHEAELLEFLFLPGFSTKEAVTELSGRGVGLDVVQNMVRAVGGVVRVSTQPGLRTRFTLQLPISMSVVRALLVDVAGEPYAFPLNRIDRILRLPAADIQTLEGRQHFVIDGQPVGLVEARQVLEVTGSGRTPGDLCVVVASDRSHRFGVVVDEFLGERDLEVRPLDPRLGKVPNLNSASVLEDGWPVLIVDVEDLVRSIDNMLSGRRLRKVGEGGDAGPAVAKGPTRVLVVDDSITVRELERQLLESHGYFVEVAVDGVDGWNAVRSGGYDLVITDVDMPRMDGIGLVTRIKRDERLRHVPVVIVSYKDREEDRMRGLDAGANAYLTKSSFQDRTFLRTVVDLVGEAVR